MRIQAIGWVLVCTLLSMPQSVSAQGVLSGLGRLALDQPSPSDPRAPVARRVAQARALGHLGDEAGAVSSLTTTLARRPTAAVRDAVLLSLAERRSPSAVPELLRALRARIGGAPLIFNALAATGGDSVIEALTEMSAGTDRPYRELALRALTRVAPASAAPILFPWMEDTHAATRLSGFRVAVARPNVLWAERMAQAVVHGSAPIDAAIITWSIARVADGAGLPALLKLTSQGVPLHCAVAIVACLRAHRESIDPVLAERARAILRREPLAAPALAWLATVGEEHAAIPAESQTHRTTRRVELRRALRAAGPEAAATRAQAAIKLARLDDPRAHVPLIAALDDPEITVRRAVVRALAVVDDDEARSALHRHAALEPDEEVAMLAEAAARGDAIALDDPWESARSLLSPTPDPSVDRGAPTLAR